MIHNIVEIIGVLLAVSAPLTVIALLFK